MVWGAPYEWAVPCLESYDLHICELLRIQVALTMSSRKDDIVEVVRGNQLVDPTVVNRRIDER